MSEAAWTIAWLLRTAAATYVVAWSGWWCVLSTIALRSPRQPRRTPGTMRWVTIVPAHNEAALIAATVESLRRAGTLLSEQPIIVVVADNCTDRTAEIARAAGAVVLERNDLEHRGKGYALEHAIACVSSGAVGAKPDAVAFVDADSLVDIGFFAEMQHVMDEGAQAAQAYYKVIAQEDNLTGLRRLAFMILHWSRPLGLSRLHLGSGLKGNGMALRWDIAATGLGSVGIAEDAAMTLALAKRGIAVTFVPRARVSGFMAATYRDAQVQDDRWERGRIGMAPRAVLTGARALLHRHPAAAVGALDVAAPPLTMLAGLASLLAALQIIAPVRAGWLAFAAVGTVGGYVGIGLLAARASRRDLMSLRMAPRFVLYKAGVLLGLLRVRRSTEWRRTSR